MPTKLYCAEEHLLAVMENTEPSPAAANTGYATNSKFRTSFTTLIDQVGQIKGEGMSEMAVVIVPACSLPFLMLQLLVFGGLTEGVNLMALQLATQ